LALEFFEIAFGAKGATEGLMKSVVSNSRAAGPMSRNIGLAAKKIVEPPPNPQFSLWYGIPEG
jgi:hypothetical protein